jgi:hypothetical protein
VNRRRLAIVAALCSAVALGACGKGDDDDGGGGGGEPLSKAEFISKADAICKEAEQKIESQPDPQELGDLVGLAESSKKVTEDSLSDLRELEPPAEVRRDYETALQTLEGQLELLDDLKSGAEDEDAEAVQKVAERAQVLDRRGDAAAKRIGLKECGGD